MFHELKWTVWKRVHCKCMASRKVNHDCWSPLYVVWMTKECYICDCCDDVHPDSTYKSAHRICMYTNKHTQCLTLHTHTHTHTHTQTHRDVCVGERECVFVCTRERNWNGRSSKTEDYKIFTGHLVDIKYLTHGDDFTLSHIVHRDKICDKFYLIKSSSTWHIYLLWLIWRILAHVTLTLNFLLKNVKVPTSVLLWLSSN